MRWQTSERGPNWRSRHSTPRCDASEGCALLIFHHVSGPPVRLQVAQSKRARENRRPKHTAAENALRELTVAHLAHWFDT